ncbi:MAG: iron ABC transporter permease [Erythrobacter sp.]|nr:iron ABC transporter permease [Erythrobacter sp.]
MPSAWSLAAVAIAGLTLVPILAVAFAAPLGGIAALQSLAETVLARYIATTAALMALTGALAVVIGTGCAWVVSACEFPGRRVFAWALVLPIAVPSYIAAYLYADLLDYGGPVQSFWREAMGAGDAFPQIRSLPGAALILALVLYPYIYLLARAAFVSQSPSQFRAARSLGAGPWRAFRQVALPAARPAIAGGLALVLMEVLADFGVAEYFALPTFSTGIFRSWLAMGDRDGAMGLAAIMLAFVIALVALEGATRRGRTFARDGLDGRARSGPLVKLSAPGKAMAVVACALPLALGFGIPALHLASLAMSKAAMNGAGALADYVRASLILGAAAGALCCVSALVLAFARARSRGSVLSLVIRLATLGYALPGALLAVGLLAPLGALDQSLTRTLRESTSYSGGLILTGTSLILIYALSVRFLTVAYNSVEGGMARIPPALDAAARSLGASPSRVLWRIYTPLLRPSLLAALALVAIDTLRELPATLILRPFNLETLATRTYRLASDERLTEASIPALILLGVGLIPVLLLTRTGARKTTQTVSHSSH